MVIGELETLGREIVLEAITSRDGVMQLEEGKKATEVMQFEGLLSQLQRDEASEAMHQVQGLEIEVREVMQLQGSMHPLQRDEENEVTQLEENDLETAS